MNKLSLINVFNLLLAFIGFIIGFYILNSLVDLNLTYHFQQPFALIDFNYFLSAIKYPAGLAGYLGSELSDLWGIPTLGLLISLILFIIIPVIEYQRLRRFANTSYAMTLSSFLFAFIILIFSDYYVNAALFFAIFIAYHFVLFTRFLTKIIKTPYLIGIFLLPIIILVYLTTGSFGLVFYVILMVSSFLINKNLKYPIFLLVVWILVLALLTPIVMSEYCYPLLTIPAAYVGNFELMKTSAVFYAVFILILVINLIIIQVGTGKPFKYSKWLSIGLAILAVLFIWFGPTFWHDRGKKQRIEIDYLAYTRQWHVLLKKAHPLMMHERVLAFQINRALYYSGGLLKNLFAFPQYLGPNSLLLEKETDSDVLIPISDIYYDMGYLNESRHWANESLTRYGKQPRILKRLAQINIIYGNYMGAKKYLELLKKTFSHKKWALNQEKYLFNESMVKQNPEYANLIKLLPKDDFFSSKSAPQLNLVKMNTYQNNNMVFEYLMAYTILEQNVARLVKSLPEFRTFQYSKLPESVQQSLIVYMSVKETMDIPMAGYSIDEAVFKQFQDYTDNYSDFTKNVLGAKSKLDKKHQHTFWYYIHFVGPNAKNKSK